MSNVNWAPSLGSIRFLTGPLMGRTFQLSKPIITIGREKSNDIFVPDPKVSRYHARLLWNNGSWSIEKLSQTSTLALNQRHVQQSVIYDNNIVGLGEDSSFLFLLPRSEFNTQVEEPHHPQSQSPSESRDVAAPLDSTTKPYLPPNQLELARHPITEQSSPHLPMANPPAQTQQPHETTIARPSTVEQQASPVANLPHLPQRPDETAIAPLSATGIPFIEVSSNTSGEKKVYPLDKPVLNVGRDVFNDIVINDRIISGLHLQIVRQANQFVLIHPHPERQKTLNGLLYQGRKIRGDETFRKSLIRGDLFRIGDENGTLITLTYNDGTGTEQETMPAVRPFKLSDSEITIGRNPDNKLVLAHPQVSAHHARLVHEGGAYRIFDLNSTNHVYVNSELTTNQLLKLGDEIRIGPYKFVYESTHLTQYDESNYIRINAHDLKKFGNNNVILLNNISLSIPPRKLVALVGGSGAGKTTLMSALNGLRPSQEGTVLYNGKDLYHNLAAFSDQLGYVPQDDIVHRDLTVERALYYAAKLRLPSDFTHEQIDQRINEVLEDVEMTGRRHLLVKKLSGGQRKRVSIALELLANPSVFFLDEPTSGLDPGLDRKMMFLLRKLADQGHTIIVVTHATNNINTCDYICFLAQGGRLAYFGPPEEAKSYFDKSDFAEIYTSLEPTEENPNIPDEAEARYKLSEAYQEYIAKPLRAEPAATDARQQQPKEIKRLKKRGNPWTQFILLFQRQLELLRNDRSTLLILLAQAPLIALFLMLLVRVEIGSGIFDPDKMIQCQSQVITSSGPIGLSTGQATLVNCDRIINYLKTNSQGITYAQQRGGVNQALQDFIPAGQGLNAQRALFLLAFIAILFGVLNASREIVKETAIYQRERTVNLGIVPYLLSKILVLGMIALFQSAVLVLIVDAFEPLHQGIFMPVLLEVYISIALAALTGMMIGLTMSAISPNEDTAQSLLPLILIPQIIFAGVEIALTEKYTTVLGLLFSSHWAMAALGTSLGLHGDKLGGDKLLGDNLTYQGTLFSTYTQTAATQRLLLAWAAMGAIVIILAIVTGIILKRKDVRR
jgi:ABC-type multidrug transport system ATPase subunit/pSer/pThr/pTyr-binding forkhead associated (FHA) protein